MLADGRLHLSGAALLCPHLTPDNREALLARVAHKSKQQIQVLLAELVPQPDLEATIRKLPVPRREDRLAPDRVAPAAGSLTDGGTASMPAQRVSPAPAPARTNTSPGVVTPSAPERYRVQFTASQALRDKLERLQALEPHSDLAALIEQAVREKLARVEARRFAQTTKPRRHLAQASTSPGPRYLPAPLKRAVYARDQGSCGFVDAQGRRCNARTHLEYHHLHPHGYGGGRSPGNIGLRCKTHNAYLARIDYGQVAHGSRRSGQGPSSTEPHMSGVRQRPSSSV